MGCNCIEGGRLICAVLSPAEKGAPLWRSPRAPGFVDRIYPLDGGLAFAPNKAMYSPGYFEGETVALSCNAFLIQRGDEWLLWDTGISQKLFHELGGEVIAHGIRGVVARPLAHQFTEVGLAPGDVSKVILSHAHFDHAGNCDLFAKSTFVVQGAELDAMFGPDYAHYCYILNCTRHCERPRCSRCRETLTCTAINPSA
jgi:glyoxylase-like metal-dependent hydrolase (beta-lactamase superfamily II)